MAFSLPTGTTYAVATTYATALNVTAATNATECVLTVTNTYAAGDFVEFTSGWANATARVFRVKSPSASQITLEGFDTSDVTQFAAGTGIGTVRKISTRQSIAQVLSCDPSGGDAQYVSVRTMDSSFQTSLPDGFSAMSLSMSIADDPTLPHHAVLKTATNGNKVTALIATLPNGKGVILFNTYVSLNETPSMASGQVMAVKCGFSCLSLPVRYAS
jgi:hypothetical protein